MTDTALAEVRDGREVALLRAIGFDKLSGPQRELALAIARTYDLDPMLRHLVMVDGRPYITRDGLLHVAHRSGQLDGIVTSEPALEGEFWRSTCSVYRKDMSHAFTYTGRYPAKGGNAKFAPEMAVKVGEVMALRRAFDVAAPTAEERWDVDATVEEAAPKPSLTERVAARKAELESAQLPEATPLPPEAPGPSDAPTDADARPSMSEAELKERIVKAAIPVPTVRKARDVLFPEAESLDGYQRAELWDALEAEQEVRR